MAYHYVINICHDEILQFKQGLSFGGVLNVLRRFQKSHLQSWQIVQNLWSPLKILQILLKQTFLPVVQTWELQKKTYCITGKIF